MEELVLLTLAVLGLAFHAVYPSPPVKPPPGAVAL